MTTDDGFEHIDRDPSDERSLKDVIKALGTVSDDGWSDYPGIVAAHVAKALAIIDRRITRLEGRKR